MPPRVTGKPRGGKVKVNATSTDLELEPDIFDRSICLDIETDKCAMCKQDHLCGIKMKDIFNNKIDREGAFSQPPLPSNESVNDPDRIWAARFGLANKPGRRLFVHYHCAVNTQYETYDETKGRWCNLRKAIQAGRSFKCERCNISGALLHCSSNIRCKVDAHVPCALIMGGVRHSRYTREFICDSHRNMISEAELEKDSQPGVRDDFSRGREPVPVLLSAVAITTPSTSTTTIDDAIGKGNAAAVAAASLRQQLSEFEYMPTNRDSDDVHASASVRCASQCAACECEGMCDDVQTCACIAKGRRYTYDGQLIPGIEGEIVECNPLCNCSTRRCTNRVVDRGLSHRLELCKVPPLHKQRVGSSLVAGSRKEEEQWTDWGVKTLDPISKHSFVCEITGSYAYGNSRLSYPAPNLPPRSTAYGIGGGAEGRGEGGAGGGWKIVSDDKYSQKAHDARLVNTASFIQPPSITDVLLLDRNTLASKTSTSTSTATSSSSSSVNSSSIRANDASKITLVSMWDDPASSTHSSVVPFGTDIVPWVQQQLVIQSMQAKAKKKALKNKLKLEARQRKRELKMELGKELKKLRQEALRTSKQSKKNTALKRRIGQIESKMEAEGIKIPRLDLQVVGSNPATLSKIVAHSVLRSSSGDNDNKADLGDAGTGETKIGINYDNAQLSVGSIRTANEIVNDAELSIPRGQDQAEDEVVEDDDISVDESGLHIDDDDTNNNDNNFDDDDYADYSDTEEEDEDDEDEDEDEDAEEEKEDIDDHINSIRHFLSGQLCLDSRFFGNIGSFIRHKTVGSATTATSAAIAAAAAAAARKMHDSSASTNRGNSGAGGLDPSPASAGVEETSAAVNRVSTPSSVLVPVNEIAAQLCDAEVDYFGSPDQFDNIGYGDSLLTDNNAISADIASSFGASKAPVSNSANNSNNNNKKSSGSSSNRNVKQRREESMFIRRLVYTHYKKAANSSGGSSGGDIGEGETALERYPRLALFAAVDIPANSELLL